ncbi:MAG: response regulator [Cyclobacteriaceae bacterium]|nr:response regulator [Cyclobacteriaceae bacterium]
MKILVVHRQKEVANHVRVALSGTEPYIRYFTSGLDGLLQAKAHDFDLIVCGIDLPVITGFEMVRSLRISSLNPNIPLVLLADEINHKVEQLSQALGVTGLLLLDELSDSLASLVTGKNNLNKQEGKFACAQNFSMN